MLKSDDFSDDPFGLGLELTRAGDELWAELDLVPAALVKRHSLGKTLSCSARRADPARSFWTAMAGGTQKYKVPFAKVLGLLADDELAALLPLRGVYLACRASASAADLLALTESPRWPAIEKLDLSLSPKLASALGPLGAAPALRDLRLDSARVSAANLAALLGGGLPSLVALDLGGNPLGEAGARALAQAAPKRLRALRLSGAELDDAAARALLSGEGFAALTALDLRNNGLTAAGLRALLESDKLPALAELRVAANEIDPAELEALSAVRGGLTWVS